jgi:imidazolonepropionase-like amidohydrolase
VLLTNATVLDPENGELHPDLDIRLTGDLIADVSSGLDTLPGEESLDIRGSTVMPGLIDAHVHVVDYSPDRYAPYGASPYYVGARAQHVLRGMLDRGFTTVRDAGGADAGLARAIEEGYIDGPRLFPSGRPISQTGGHADLRITSSCPTCARHDHPMMGAIADGIAEVQRAAREELRRAASQIKMMISGGIDSPHDRVTAAQYSIEEIAAAVAEAAACGTYVMAHAYTSESIRRGLRAGVRSIEHGNFLDHDGATDMARRGAFLVPTLAVYEAMRRGDTSRTDAPAPNVIFHDMLESGLRSLELASEAGTNIVFGTDLMGGNHHMQSLEFRLRGEVLPPAEVIRSATSMAAELLGLAGRLGVIRPNALADLLILDADPLSDLTILADPAAHLQMIIKSGKIIRRRN